MVRKVSLTTPVAAGEAKLKAVITLPAFRS